MNDSFDTYAPIFLGFWSMQFLKGWGSVILIYLSIAWITYQFASRIISDIKKSDIKKKKRKK